MLTTNRYKGTYIEKLIQLYSTVGTTPPNEIGPYSLERVEITPKVFIN